MNDDLTTAPPDAHEAPRLPHSAAAPPVPMAAQREPGPAQASHGANYRSDQRRQRSVHRRANPWYRQLIHRLLGLAILGAVGVGIFIGATEIRDYLNRDKLPAPGQETAPVRSTTISFTGPGLTGTVTVDTQSRAYDFTGSRAGATGQLRILSPDGQQAYLDSGGGWSPVAAGNADHDALHAAMAAALAVVDPDDVLENRLRQGFIELHDQTEVAGDGGEGATVQRYTMTLAVERFAAEFPLQWETVRSVLPGVDEVETALTLEVDADNVVVALALTNPAEAQPVWSWERLAYGPDPFIVPEPTI